MVRVRVLGSFCAAPNLDVTAGSLLDVEPWVAREWAYYGHVEVQASDVAEVLEGDYVVDPDGADVVVVS